jgi:hypothetical protein
MNDFAEAWVSLLVVVLQLLFELGNGGGNDLGETGENCLWRLGIKHGSVFSWFIGLYLTSRL